MRFHYIALDQKGNEVCGELNAADDNEAIAKVRDCGLHPTKVVEIDDGSNGVASDREASERGLPDRGDLLEETTESPQETGNEHKVLILSAEDSEEIELPVASVLEKPASKKTKGKKAKVSSFRRESSAVTGKMCEKKKKKKEPFFDNSCAGNLKTLLTPLIVIGLLWLLAVLNGADPGDVINPRKAIEYLLRPTKKF